MNEMYAYVKYESHEEDEAPKVEMIARRVDRNPIRLGAIFKRLEYRNAKILDYLVSDSEEVFRYKKINFYREKLLKLEITMTDYRNRDDEVAREAITFLENDSENVMIQIGREVRHLILAGYEVTDEVLLKCCDLYLSVLVGDVPEAQYAI